MMDNSTPKVESANHSFASNKKAVKAIPDKHINSCVPFEYRPGRKSSSNNDSSVISATKSIGRDNNKSKS